MSVAAAPETTLRQRAEDLGSVLPPLLVRAERVAASVAQGVHGRRRAGQGEAFWQYRHYQPGDSAHAIDWRQSARSQSLFVRETEWEAAQSVWLWADCSASMDWRSKLASETKADRAKLILLATAALLLRAGERVALLGDPAPPSAARSALIRLAASLAGMSQAPAPANAPAHASAPAPVSALPPPHPVPRHARLVLIGDFLDPVGDFAQVLATYAGRGVGGHVVHLLDPAEQALPWRGRVRYAGLEGEASLLVPRSESLAEAYGTRIMAQIDGVRAAARAAGFTCALHLTSGPASAALLDIWAAMGTV